MAEESELNWVAIWMAVLLEQMLRDFSDVSFWVSLMRRCQWVGRVR